MPFFVFKGEKVFYQEKGKGLAIFLIHGFLGSHLSWSKLAPDLSKSFRVISIDLPGHGKSKPIGYIHSMEMYAECVEVLMKQKKIRKGHIIGHSLGGYVAMAFAELFPDKVNSIVLVNSSSKGDNEKRKSERELIINQVLNSRETIISLLVKSFFVVNHTLRRYWVKSYLDQALKCSGRGIVASIQGMKDRKEREIVLKFAPYPVLIVSGKYDPLITPQRSKEESNLAKGGEFLLLENSGHMSLYEEPYKLAKAILKFIKKTR